MRCRWTWERAPAQPRRRALADPTVPQLILAALPRRPPVEDQLRATVRPSLGKVNASPAAPEAGLPPGGAGGRGRLTLLEGGRSVASRVHGSGGFPWAFPVFHCGAYDARSADGGHERARR